MRSKNEIGQAEDGKEQAKILFNPTRPAGQVSTAKINFNTQPAKQATLIVGGSDKSDEEYDREDDGASSSSGFRESEDSGSQHANVRIEQFDSFSRARSHIEVPLNEDMKLKLLFLRKISDR